MKNTTYDFFRKSLQSGQAAVKGHLIYRDRCKQIGLLSRNAYLRMQKIAKHFAIDDEFRMIWRTSYNIVQTYIWMCPDQIRDNFGILLDVYKTFAMMVKMLNIKCLESIVNFETFFELLQSALRKYPSACLQLQWNKNQPKLKDICRFCAQTQYLRCRRAQIGPPPLCLDFESYGKTAQNCDISYLQIDKTVHMTMMCGCTLFLAFAQKREPRSRRNARSRKKKGICCTQRLEQNWFGCGQRSQIWCRCRKEVQSSDQNLRSQNADLSRRSQLQDGRLQNWAGCWGTSSQLKNVD